MSIGIAETKLEFHTLTGASEDCLATLVLNRPNHANAFSAQMMEEITFHMETVARRTRCRGLIITGAGKHFSAGADLTWMQSSASLSYNDNVKDSNRLATMFESVVHLPVPTIALVRGATYGGAVGLVACCDFAIAHTQAKFCLSEARLGLLPAVISPYLARKMKPGQLRRHALTGRVFSADEACAFGLVEVVAQDDLSDVVHTELQNLIHCGPEAQKAVSHLLTSLRGDLYPQSQDTVHAIAKARTSEEGQSGLRSFFSKTQPPWVFTLPESLASELSGQNLNSTK